MSTNGVPVKFQLDLHFLLVNLPYGLIPAGLQRFTIVIGALFFEFSCLPSVVCIFEEIPGVELCVAVGDILGARSYVNKGEFECAPELGWKLWKM